MNNSPKDILFKDDARKGMLAGINKLADAVRETMGPRGRNVAIERSYGEPYITKDGVTVAKEIDLENPVENMGAQMVKSSAGRVADDAGDGPQPLWSKILTPRGFITMGDAAVGMEICGTRGTIQTILGVYPKGLRDLYEVHFSDGQVVECCLDHLFTVSSTHRGTRKTITLGEIYRDYVVKDSSGFNKHRYYVDVEIPEMVSVLENMPIDPYFLGLLIGDGSLTGSGSVELSLGVAKEHVLDKIVTPPGITFTASFVPERNYLRVKFKGSTTSGKSLLDIVSELGLKVGSADKFIPESYLYASITDRSALLQGLIDTDGHVNVRGLAEFSTVSEKLARDYHTLMLSLGRHTSVSYHERRSDDGSYSDVGLFKLYERKGYKFGNKIVCVVPTGKTVEMQCIKVSNDDHLYITDGFIPTHNTTTATVLTAEIATRGFSLLAASHAAVELKRGIDKAVTVVVEELLDMAKPVSSNQDIINVGTISANGEEEIGLLIASAIDKVGDDGIVTVRESSTSDSYLAIEDGMSIDRGVIEKAFLPDNCSSVTYEGALVMAFSKEIHTVNDVIPAIKHITDLQNQTKRKHPVVMFVNDMNNATMALLVSNMKQRGVLNIAVVKTPGHGVYREAVLEDIACYTGATVLGDKHKPHMSVVPQDFGYLKSVTIDASKTVMISGTPEDAGPEAMSQAKAAQERVEQRLAFLNKSKSETSSEFDKDRLSRRIASLSGGIAVLYVGGNSDTEVKEKKDRVDDALHATYAASEMGIVPGGGTALIVAAAKARTRLSEMAFPNESQKAGAFLVLDAVKAPCRQICVNAGYPADVVIDKIEQGGGEVGYNAATGEYVNLLEIGVIDPVKVTITALTQASSIAGMFLTTSCVIHKKRTDNPLYDMSTTLGG